MKKIAVTGAFGHLGVNLVLALNAQGIIPRALVHHKTVDMITVDSVKGDINDLDSLRNCFAGVDVVYHLASKISVFDQDDALLHRVNVEGTRHVIEACLHHHVKRLVYVGSIRAFHAKPLSDVLTETSALVEAHQGFSYDRSKAESVRLVEQAVQRGLDVVTVFPPAILGPYDYNLSPMTRFFLDLYHGKIPMLVQGHCHCVDMSDLVAMLMAAGEQTHSAGRYIVSGHRLTIRELVDLISDITGKKMPKIYLPINWVSTLAPVIRLYGRIMKRNELEAMTSEMTLSALSQGEMSSQKAMQDFGYHPRAMRETVESIFVWFAKMGWV